MENCICPDQKCVFHAPKFAPIHWHIFMTDLLKDVEFIFGLDNELARLAALNKVRGKLEGVIGLLEATIR